MDKTNLTMFIRPGLNLHGKVGGGGVPKAKGVKMKLLPLVGW